MLIWVDWFKSNFGGDGVGVGVVIFDIGINWIYLEFVD